MEVKDWIREKLNAGVPPEDIKQELINKGYDPRILEDVQKELILNKLKKVLNENHRKNEKTERKKFPKKISVFIILIIATLSLFGYHYVSTQNTISKDMKEASLIYFNSLSEKIQQQKKDKLKYVVSEDEYQNIPSVCSNDSQFIKAYYDSDKEYEEGVPQNCGGGCTYYVMEDHIKLSKYNSKYGTAILSKNNLSNLKPCVAERAKDISSRYYLNYVAVHLSDSFLDLVDETKTNINNLGKIDTCEDVGEFQGNILNVMLAVSELSTGYTKLLLEFEETQRKLLESVENYTYENKTEQEILNEIKNKREVIFNSKIKELCKEIKEKYPKVKGEAYNFDNVENLTGMDLSKTSNLIINFDFSKCRSMKKAKELNENFIEKESQELKEKCNKIDKKAISEIALLYGYIKYKK